MNHEICGIIGIWMVIGCCLSIGAEDSETGTALFMFWPLLIPILAIIGLFKILKELK